MWRNSGEDGKQCTVSEKGRRSGVIFAILNAAFIYGLILIFERRRRELDDFDFGKIAVIPPFIYLGLSLLVMFLNLGIWGTWAALTPARAFAYSLAVLIFDLALMTLFASRL